MKPRIWVSVVVVFLNVGTWPVPCVNAQSVRQPERRPRLARTCSPAPCVVSPLQASEGGLEVADAPIVADPVNPQRLLLGATDFNCQDIQLLSFVGFYLSSDGGTTWSAPSCLAGGIQSGRYSYFPGGDPMVGFDRNGNAYIAGTYFDNQGGFTGFAGFEKSGDGTNWSAPAPALGAPNSNSLVGYTWLAVDTSPASPFVNSVYISGVRIGPAQDNSKNQVTVAHSSDAGHTWITSKVAPVQVTPAGDVNTNLVVGGDGTLYLTWLYCNSGPFYFCSDNKAHMVFSKSIDGGNTWSKPVLMTTIVLGPGLPNTKIVAANTPVIGVDKSHGPYSENLYVVMYSWTGTYMQVGVIRSSDRGDTWSKPVPVSPPSAKHDQFFPWLSVSPTGLVGVSWLDRRNDPANINYQPFAAISADGGRTFNDVLLSSAFSNPNNNGYPDSLWMGNYTGNTWAGPNFIAAWMDSSNGVNMQIMVGGLRLK